MLLLQQQFRCFCCCCRANFLMALSRLSDVNLCSLHSQATTLAPLNGQRFIIWRRKHWKLCRMQDRQPACTTLVTFSNKLLGEVRNLSRITMRVYYVVLCYTHCSGVAAVSTGSCFGARSRRIRAETGRKDPFPLP